MRLSPFACVLALAGCAAAPHTELAYELRTTVYDMPTELAQSLTGLDASGGLPVPASLMGRAAEAARSRSDVEANSRPMIRVREGSTAEISNMSGTDYIQDYTVGADGKTQAVHATAEDGLALEMRPRAREAQLELDFRVKRCQLASWTEESERTLSNGETVKLKYPIVAKREVHSKATLAQGECLAVMLSTTNSGRTTLVCVSAVAIAGGR